jgi:hypothetical protein
MPGLVRLCARATSAVGLLLASTLAVAQDGQGFGARQVLACLVAESLPAPPAEAREGGFAFVFESLGGTAVDGRACTVYRLRNLPGSPPTPVRWSTGSEVLVDVASLARCREEAACAWFEVARYFDGAYVGGETVIGYGLNADSFRIASPGLVAISFPDLGATAASVGTELVGTLVDSEGREVVLDLVVKSRIERGEDGLVLVYEAQAGDPSQLGGSHFVLAWEALDDLPPDAVAPGGMGPFRARSSGEAVPSVTTEPGLVAVVVTSDAAVYEDALLLTVREAGEGGADLLTVVLPAFLPAVR